MITGLYLSKWSTIDPTKFKTENNGLPLDFAILRAAGGGYADAKFESHRAFFEKTPGKDGRKILLGTDVYLGYAPGSPPGKKQAEDFWNIINKTGFIGDILPEIDVEHQPKEITPEGRVASYWPVPSNFMTVWLEPMVKFLQDKLGYSPMVYCSLNIISEFFKNNPPGWLLSCPLHIAHYGVSSPGFKFWPEWVFWQSTNTTTWPGISSVCIEKFNGSRAELEHWCKNPVVVVEPPPPVVIPSTGELSEILAALERTEKLCKEIRAHFN